MFGCFCISRLQVRAELSTAEASLATATADRLQLQQELSSKSDQLMLLESELRLKASRLDAAQQQLATEAEEHAAERALLQRQLEQLMVRSTCNTAFNAVHAMHAGLLSALLCYVISGLDRLCEGYSRCMSCCHTALYHLNVACCSSHQFLMLHVATAAHVQADKEEARSQLAAATADVESTSQQLAAASSAHSQAEQALQELQQLHDKLVAEQAELQAKVCGVC
jgi:chromosome segregation ATPase